jgi:CheY-like chemotaxis protein
VMARAVETTKPLIDSRQQVPTISCPHEAVWLDGDFARLNQVATNLLNNAVKYTPEGGRIWLSVRREGNDSIFSVRDNGVGIQSEMLPHIFDPFTQVERTLDRNQGGLGIGLTLVRHLVELHGGNVRAFSAGPDRGSEFVVRLPALPSAERAASEGEKRPNCGLAERISQERAASEGDPSGARRISQGRTMREDREGPARGGNGRTAAPFRILVVDDNVDAAESMAVLLRLHGHEVRTAYDGPGGLEAARAFRPQAVLLDIGLPRMDGYEVARRLRGEQGLEKILLVAVTGYGQEEARLRGRVAGFDSYLVKPADLVELQQLLVSSRGAGCQPVQA